LQFIFANKFWIDELYDLLLVGPFKRISAFLAVVIDPKVVDGLALLPARISSGVSIVLNVLQSGLVQFYLTILLLGGLWVLWHSMKGWVI